MSTPLPRTDGTTPPRAYPGASTVNLRSSGFDPLSDLLVAQLEKPAHLVEPNLRTLTPYQRALLTIDGTVTKFIEAYRMEPVNVVLLDQQTHELEAAHPWLEIEQGTTVISRQVLLQGRYSRTLFAYAVSLLVHDQLPEAVREDLKVHPGGIGQVLIKNRLETRREVLWYGREHIDALPEPVCSMTDGRFISRTYRIICKGNPFMLINEKFPVSVGQMMDHH